ncbi:PREDICTED: uncharacterized protein LOC105450577 [Wasmannia auropunctata]|uniref:uncharacterized protein LOC105450577 n=1 Tax=Wasmannia auropunctata TaxID=64793 RepID=UPI0005EF850D|nr:PREDICTED: uncharacterized protein LOC105450577 [Wasmannia auropunctata]
MEEPKKKSRRVSKNDDGTMQNNEMTSEVLKVLLCPYLLRNIFQYLPYGRHLAKAARVCRSWEEAANNENKTRDPCYIVETHSCTIYQSPNFPNVRLENWTSDFIENIRNIRIKPSVCLFFVDKNAANSEEYKVLENCETIKLYNDGIIKEHEYKDDRYPDQHSEKMLCAFLPQIPNVRVKSFKLPENCIISETAEYQEIISTIVNNETPKEGETPSLNHETCFMLFCNEAGYTTADRWASAILKSKENKVVSNGVVR